jgi:hypothetical protein
MPSATTPPDGATATPTGEPMSPAAAEGDRSPTRPASPRPGVHTVPGCLGPVVPLRNQEA